MSHFVIFCSAVVDQLPRLGRRELICLLLFTCNYMVFVRRSFLFLWVLRMGCVILLWHSLSLPYDYFSVTSIWVKIIHYLLWSKFILLDFGIIRFQLFWPSTRQFEHETLK